MAVVAVGIIISEKLDILILCSWGEERQDEIMEQISRNPACHTTCCGVRTSSRQIIHDIDIINLESIDDPEHL